MTNLTRWDPCGEMPSLRDAMNRRFEDSFVNPAAATQSQALSMPVDLRETDDGFIVDAVVPGVKPEDVNITLENNVLTISGETKQEQQAGESQPNYHRVERRYGRFPANARGGDRRFEKQCCPSVRRRYDRRRNYSRAVAAQLFG